MATDGIQEQNVKTEFRRKPNSNSIDHLSGCSSVALWLVVGIVGSYIFYGLMVWMTSTTPVSVLR